MNRKEPVRGHTGDTQDYVSGQVLSFSTDCTAAATARVEPPGHRSVPLRSAATAFVDCRRPRRTKRRARFAPATGTARLQLPQSACLHILRGASARPERGSDDALRAALPRAAPHQCPRRGSSPAPEQAPRRSFAERGAGRGKALRRRCRSAPTVGALIAEDLTISRARLHRAGRRFCRVCPPNARPPSPPTPLTCEEEGGVCLHQDHHHSPGR